MKLSIITPVYNREDCIERCIDSVIKAIGSTTKGDVEQIIVDDGSKDRTADRIRPYTEKYTHIHFERFPKNKGTNAARNAAIAAATGDFCIILDSDDFFVDSALETIFSTLELYPGYKHYMFAPDDCVEYYRTNPIINGAATKIILYSDFLNGRIGRDFIHVIATATLHKFPFIENLRTYEGLFFLQFYREAEKMFFCNKVVTIRERGRADSVSLDFLRTSKAVIKRNVSCLELRMEWFKEDYISMGITRQLYATYKGLVENHLLLSQYEKAQAWATEWEQQGGNIPSTYKWIMRLHLGFIFRMLLKEYLLLKYKVLKKKFN